MTKRERCLRAKECHEKGLNCGQSVLLAFTDVTGLTEAQSMAVASGFGGGLSLVLGVLVAWSMRRLWYWVWCIPARWKMALRGKSAPQS